jgi:hypothetical protein
MPAYIVPSRLGWLDRGGIATGSSERTGCSRFYDSTGEGWGLAREWGRGVGKVRETLGYAVFGREVTGGGHVGFAGLAWPRGGWGIRGTCVTRRTCHDSAITVAKPTCRE